MVGSRANADGILLIALFLPALAACSGDGAGDAAGGSAGMTATTGGSAGARNQGGATGSGGARSQGGSVGSASGGVGGAVDLSSDPGSGTCPNFTPCGGDVLGTWRIESACLDTITPDFPTCPEAKVNITLTGSLTFMSDGSYIPRGTSTARTSLPPSCSTLCTAGQCTTTADGGCTCVATQPVNETPLIYSTTGSKLMVQLKSGFTQTAYYCRDGDQLWMRGYSSANTRYEYDLRR